MINQHKALAVAISSCCSCSEDIRIGYVLESLALQPASTHFDSLDIYIWDEGAVPVTSNRWVRLMLDLLIRRGHTPNYIRRGPSRGVAEARRNLISSIPPSHDKILLVDDIFDSGKTINHLAQFFLNRGILRSDLKIVVHDYKYYYDKEEQLPIQPDYWCRKHEISVNKEDIWIHYMHHELVGLTEEELEEYYYSQDPQLRDVLALINEK